MKQLPNFHVLKIVYIIYCFNFELDWLWFDIHAVFCKLLIIFVSIKPYHIIDDLLLKSFVKVEDWSFEIWGFITSLLHPLQIFFSMLIHFLSCVGFVLVLIIVKVLRFTQYEFKVWFIQILGNSFARFKGFLYHFKLIVHFYIPVALNWM